MNNSANRNFFSFLSAKNYKSVFFSFISLPFLVDSSDKNN